MRSFAWVIVIAVGCGGSTTSTPATIDDANAIEVEAIDGAPIDGAIAESSVEDVAIEAAIDVRSETTGFAEDPVVFVHGYGGSPANYAETIAYFKAAGYPESHLHAIQYTEPSGGSNIAQALELAKFIDGIRAKLGVERVDLVAHSQGGLSTRWYIAFGGGKDTVRDYVSLAGVHHGNDNGCFISTTGAKEVCPAYTTDLTTVQGKLNGDPSKKDVDETPFGVEEGGAIHWHAFWSDVDIVIRPANSECLDQASKGDCSAKLNERFSIAHTEFPKNKDVLKAMLEHLRAHNASKP